MRQILILGAGKSSGVLIDYLAGMAPKQDWEVCVADLSAAQALEKTKGRPFTTAMAFDYQNEKLRRELIASSDLVISMLPASVHPVIAQDCLRFQKHLLTPSYISDAMKKLHRDAKQRGLLFLNELGLDPGIDHMSALQIIHRLEDAGAQITGYRSHCGGLIAPQSDSNRWHYKFTWNPRNVVLAGQGEGHIRYLQNGKIVQVPYEKLFTHTQLITIRGYGKFESYPNRDSLKYTRLYGLKHVKTMYRGTLRRPPFCKGWNVLVQLGLTSQKEIPTTTLQRQVQEKLARYRYNKYTSVRMMLQEIKLMERLQNIPSPTVVPCDFLQETLESAWKLSDDDKDMVVMLHEISYKLSRKKYTLRSSMVYVGDDASRTAMAATVGLPIGIAAKLALNNQIKQRGVMIPRYPEIYEPILAELREHGIVFREKIEEV
ncbi:MAG: saccharopine dehydrogenase NADP-binding domain-containing protein [Chitinophagales bacterium]|nr:saccharopine dehydrogenase NADP-binding domain-containing protein [Chitinophagales bacterium]MDW8420136.1 saccharopine dehydrogenase C-terminal domain-containing protein [Chitinophagales bacterium]